MLGRFTYLVGMIQRGKSGSPLHAYRLIQGTGVGDALENAKWLYPKCEKYWIGEEESDDVLRCKCGEITKHGELCAECEMAKAEYFEER